MHRPDSVQTNKPQKEIFLLFCVNILSITFIHLGEIYPLMTTSFTRLLTTYVISLLENPKKNLQQVSPNYSLDRYKHFTPPRLHVKAKLNMKLWKGFEQ